MMIQNKNTAKKFVLLCILILLSAATLLFFIGEKLLPEGWYYIPKSAVTVAVILYILWMGICITAAYFLLKKIKLHLRGVFKATAMVLTVFAAFFLALFLAWHLFLYSLKFEVKEEQYDQHIALYVKNTFIRPEYRYPHYQYEENWLLMRNLTNDELRDAVQKYGDPDNYYKH